ncbi:DEAD DEAH box helicase [Coemansia sp. RSA 2336]|nr:DEAD DEAH box helicase [Coemansia sp. RSA 2336]
MAMAFRHFGTISPFRLHVHGRSLHTLRPYQQECIDKCLDSLKNGIWRQAVSLPVGSGKTVVFASLLQRIPAPTPMATKTLVLAHREELLVQAARQIQRASPNLVVEIDQGSRVANPAADVVVASVPTLGRQDSPRLLRHDPHRYKCIVIDEAHHAAASTYGRIIDHFASNRKILVWGCSATLHRHDGLGLSGVFDKIVYQKRFIEMIRERWLSPIRVITVRTATRLDAVRSYAGEFSTSSLSRIVNHQERNLAVVQAYRSLAADRKSVLVFAVDVAHAKALTMLFNRYQVNAHYVLGSTSAGERERILHEFRAGRIPVVVNCGILTEGTDIPNIDCVIMARPTRSPVLFQQMLGRGMRLHAGKSDCLIVDFVDSFKHDNAQVTVPTLLGLDPSLVLDSNDNILDENALRRKNQLKRDPENEMADEREARLRETVQSFEESLNERMLPKTLTSLKALGFKAHVHLNPLRFFELGNRPAHMSGAAFSSQLEVVSSGDTNLTKLSRYSWVCLSADRYLLNVSSRMYYVTRKDSLWHGSTRSLRQYVINGSRKMHYTKEQPIELQAETLAMAIKGMDSLVGSSLSNVKKTQLFWTAPWRYKPPTSRQISMLTKLGIHVPESVKRLADSETHSKVRGLESTLKEPLQPAREQLLRLTRGTAANLILRLTHGSSKQWKQIEATNKRISELQLKRQSAVAAKAIWTH